MSNSFQFTINFEWFCGEIVISYKKKYLAEPVDLSNEGNELHADICNLILQLVKELIKKQ